MCCVQELENMTERIEAAWDGFQQNLTPLQNWLGRFNKLLVEVDASQDFETIYSTVQEHVRCILDAKEASAMSLDCIHRSQQALKVCLSQLVTLRTLGVGIGCTDSKKCSQRSFECCAVCRKRSSAVEEK